jgi:dTDP-4-dehydrorhamnose reductase
VRILVTGASGLLGGRLAALLGPHRVVAARHAKPTLGGQEEVPLDLRSSESIESAVGRARPDAIVHCAALADADRCEADPEEARRLNAEAPALLARRCRRLGVKLIAVSTDLVFDGSRSFVRETDPARPILVYGRTKLAGEDAVLSEHPDAAVVRVALLHGRGCGPRASASEAVAWGLRAGRPFRMFTDQYRTPVDPESVAQALRRLLDGSARGRFHLGGALRVSRHELALRVARLFGLSPEPIGAVRQADHPLGAPRPADVSLDSGRARRELGWAPRPLDDGLRESRLVPE